MHVNLTYPNVLQDETLTNFDIETILILGFSILMIFFISRFRLDFAILISDIVHRPNNSTN